MYDAKLKPTVTSNILHELFPWCCSSTAGTCW